MTWKAREYDYHTRLIETAGEINNYMPEFVVERVMKLLNREKKPLNGARVLLLGVAYKNDIDDLRESPALKVIDNFNKELAIVSYHDPYIPEFKWKDRIYTSIELTEEALREADVVVITTGHTVIDYDWVVKNARLVFDTRNATKNVKNTEGKVYKL